jgi:glycerol-3-phosphate O-acyltransferase
MPKRTLPKKENNLLCEFCKISYNVASRYKVLNCSNSPNFFKRHNFKQFEKVIAK